MREVRSRLRALQRVLATRSDEAAIVTFGGLAFCASVLWVVLNMLLDPSRRIGPYGTTALVLWLAVVAVASPYLVRGLHRVGRRLDDGSLVVRVAVPGLMIAAGFVVLVTIGWATLRDPGFDAQRVYESAAGLAQGAGPSAPEYFREYPNNILILLTLARYFALIKHLGVADGDLLLGAVVLNAVVLTVGLLLTYLCARRLAGGLVGITSLVLAAPFVVVSPWIGTPYTDTLGLIFPVAVLYCYLRARDAGASWTRWAWWILVGVSAAVGYSVKPTVIFALLAIVAVVVCSALQHADGLRSLVSPVIVVTTLAVVTVATVASIVAVEDASGVVGFDIAANDQAFPAAHFLKMGTQGEGMFSGEDVAVTRATPPADRSRAAIEVYLDRVRAMGLDGYVDFLARKNLATMSDGSFFQWREGGQLSAPFRRDDGFSRKVQAFYGPDGDRHGSLLLFWQVGWVVVLTLVAAPLVARGRALFGDPAAVMRLALLGLVVFLMFFEARSRYVYLYVPYFAMLAALSVAAIVSRTQPGDQVTAPARGRAGSSRRGAHVGQAPARRVRRDRSSPTEPEHL